jgi:glycosyltransferase involved in cell wall biosynthesis
VYKHNRSFVVRDLEMLKKHYKVKSYYFSFKTFFHLLSLIYKSDIVFIWFVSYHAFFSTFFAKLLLKKIVVVTGGYDVAGEKEIKYGLMLNPIFKRLVKYVLLNSDKILAVSEFNKKEIERYLGMQNIEMIYNSIDNKKFYPQGKKQDIVATVGFITWDNVKRKGLDTFVKAAKYLPNVNFMVIGKSSDDSIDYLKSIASKNVIFTGFVSDNELLKYYQEIKVYCQLSFYESFGMTPAEAMLCECIPVVVNRGALPEVVGDTGFFVEYGDVRDTAEAIKKALISNNGKKAHDRVATMFSPEYREKKLVDVLESI